MKWFIPWSCHCKYGVAKYLADSKNSLERYLENPFLNVADLLEFEADLRKPDTSDSLSKET